MMHFFSLLLLRFFFFLDVPRSKRDLRILVPAPGMEPLPSAVELWSLKH